MAALNVGRKKKGHDTDLTQSWVQ